MLTANHYHMRLALDPPRRAIDVTATITLEAVSDSGDTLEFYLHRQLVIDTLSGDHITGHTFDVDDDIPATLPRAGRLRVNFDGPLRAGQSITVQLTYGGTIDDVPESLPNALTPAWVELGLYLPWFPYNEAYGEFTFDLAVECDPAYTVRGYGTCDQPGGPWQFACEMPTNDIVVVAAPALKTVTAERDPFTISIHHVDLDDAAAAQMAADVLDVLHDYDGWFGGDAPWQVTVIPTQRQHGGGYGRRGLAVLGDALSGRAYLDDRQRHFLHLAHEFAHIWWWGAPVDTWENWLNEGFAEYSALLAVRDEFGAGAYNALIAQKRDALAGTPPIWGFEHSPDDSHTQDVLLYDKAPVLLHHLDALIGHERFLELCRAMIGHRVNSTARFLRLLNIRDHEDAGRWIEQQLRTR